MPHDTHHLTAAGLGGGLDPALPVPSQGSKGLGRAGRRPPLHHSPFAPESWQRRLLVTFPLGFLGRDVFSLLSPGPGRDCFAGVHKTCPPATLKGSADHRAGPPARLLSAHRGSPVAQHLAQISAASAITAHKVTWPKLNSLKAWLKQRFITLGSQRTTADDETS